MIVAMSKTLKIMEAALDVLWISLRIACTFAHMFFIIMEIIVFGFCLKDEVTIVQNCAKNIFIWFCLIEGEDNSCCDVVTFSIDRIS